MSSRQATEQAQQAQVARASERFSRSVEELGSSSLTERTGAVYAFGGLMRDSKNDEHAIVDILSSFIRSRATPAQGVRAEGTQTPADIVAALTVLRGHPIRLRGVDLSGYDLAGADLTEADLSGADLVGADLTGADLASTLLIRAQLRGAHLNGAYLADAHLTGAHLDGARLSDANLTGASLSGAHLNGADLTGADLTSADLTETTLTDADFERADLSGAILTSADLSHVRNLLDATFTGAFCGLPADPDCTGAVQASGEQ